MFWSDIWIGDKPLSVQFPRLFLLTFSSNFTVAKALSENMSLIRFRRILWGDTADMWFELKDICGKVVLNDQEDKCTWLLTKSGRFSVRSLYLALKTDQAAWPHRKLWHVKIPLKVKVFLWLMLKNSVLARDNLAKRNWKGKDRNCSFCDNPETVEHLFRTCVVARFMWGVIRSVTGINDIPAKIEDFSAWIEKFPRKLSKVIAVGVAAVF